MKNVFNISHHHRMDTADDSEVLSPVISSIKESREKLRVVTIDDEALARRGLRRILETYPEVEIVGECSDGSEAIEVLRRTRPDLIFLDIEMPQINGFEVVEKIKPNQSPFIVFVTAHEQYALDAFKVHAIDYLVKPVCEERIGEVLQRALHKVRQNRLKEIDSRLDTILHIIGTQNKSVQNAAPLERVTIKNHGRIYFVETSSIDWIQADGNYVTLHTGSTRHLQELK